MTYPRFSAHCFKSITRLVRWGQESKIEFIVEDGEIKKIRIKNVRGKKPLPKKQLRDFEHLTKKLSYEIIQTWVDYFVFKKTIVTKKIERKL